MWLKWDAALSILGHEVEIKRTYEQMIRSRRRPRLFFDIGANYGLHSLLFLVHGVPTVSFEPNPRCHGYLRQVAELNKVHIDPRPVALGDTEGFAELWFPETQTWLGTTDPEVRKRLQGDGVIKVRVPLATLDQVVDSRGCSPDLIKIDTEGNELAILRGGRRTLQRHRPVLIFESWRGEKRRSLWSFLEGANYRINGLPFSGCGGMPGLDGASFCEEPGTNFIALPKEREAGVSDLFP